MFTKINRTTVILLALLLIFSATIGMPFGTPFESQVFASQRRERDFDRKVRVSDDLREKVRRDRTTLVPAIIQFEAAPDSLSFHELLGEIRRSGGVIKKRFRHIKAVAVLLPPSALGQLATLPGVDYISVDRPTEMTGHLEKTTGATLVRNYGTTSTGSIKGTGIGIAILDSGLDPEHHAFYSTTTLTTRVVANVDFTGQGRIDDPYGHGTHVAGIAAANAHIANGSYTGIAPNAKLINVRVLNSQGQGSVSTAIAGIDWCIANKATYNIRVMNLSLGTTAVDSYRDDPLCLAVRRAVEAGIVVCVAAGNLGKDPNGNKVYGAIHSPGIEPSAITVGATNTYGTDGRMDDGVASYSSRGPTRGAWTDTNGVKHYDNHIKPDLVAPGNKLISAKSPANYLVTQNPTLNANGCDLKCDSGEAS